VHTAYKKAARAPTTPDEAVEAAGLEADPEAEPEGLAELATGTLLLPAGAEGATTGAELPAGAETAGAELKTGGATARALLVTIHEQ
jgi:hypothetical protein